MTLRGSRLGVLQVNGVFLMALVLLLGGCAGAQTAENPAKSSALITNSPATKLSDALAGLPRNNDGYVDLSPQQLSDALPASGLTLVNVHIPYAGELLQTDLFIPYVHIAQQANKLPDKHAPIVLYCRSGYMSTVAAKDLVKLGYTNVMELDGGMAAWESAGYQVLQKQ